MTAARRKTRDHDHDNDDQPTGNARTGKAHSLSYSGKFALMAAVSNHPKTTKAAISASSVLLDFHNQTLGFSWPSLDTMAERMQVSRSTAKAAVAQLVELGFFRKEAVFIGGEQGSNRMFPIMVATTDKGRWTGFEEMDRKRSADRGGPIRRPRGGRNFDRGGGRNSDPRGGRSVAP